MDRSTRGDEESDSVCAAASKGDALELSRLIVASANINSTAASGSTALFQSAHAGHADCARLLVAAHAAVNKGSADLTPLAAACAQGHEDLVHILVAAQAAPDLVVTPDSRTPLELSASRGSEALVKLLLASRASNGGALHIACETGHVGCVRQLVHSRAAVK